MSKFTPGPWIKRYADRVTAHDDTDGTKSIAHVYDGKYQDGNRSLIAAAPELYAHAWADIDELEYYVGNPSAWNGYSEDVSELLRRTVKRARTAIAKAEGRS